VTLEDTQRAAGFGAAAHRNAYSTLYGDGHTTSYGDPQERLVWHKQGFRDGSAGSYNNVMYGGMDYNTLSVNWEYRVLSRYATHNSNEFVDNMTAWSVWHGFDLDAGIDN